MSDRARMLVVLLGMTVLTCPAWAAETRPASQPAIEGDRAWLLRQFDKELHRVLSESPRPVDNAQGAIAWGYAYLLEALAEVVQATHEPSYAEQFVRVADDVIAARDDKHNRRDAVRGKVLPAWGSVKYTDGKHYVWAVHTGMIVAPMAQFATIVKRDDKLRARFGKDADRLLQVATEAMAAHEDQYRDGPGPDEGYLYGYWMKSRLPLNQQLTPGRAYLWLYEATGEARYRQRVERLVQFTLKRVRRLPDGAIVWCYWPPLDGPGDGFEDTSHASITTDFLAQCVEHKLAPAEVLGALEKTFLTRVLLGSDTVADYLSGKGVNAFRYAPFLWGRLARHNPIIRSKLIEYIRSHPSGCDDGVFIEGPLVGYAQLLAATPEENRTAIDKTNLIGHWPLSGDCRDVSGNGNHGTNHGVDLSGKDGARFDGMNHYIEVPDHPSLHLGTGDFTISAWVKLNKDVTGVIGDIITKYDPSSRKGLNLQITASSPGYSSVSNSRHVFFGIDNAKLGPLVDCGKPWPSNTLVSTLIAYDGDLYTGIADALNPQEACHVFRYAGEKRWVDCGRLGTDPLTKSVYSVVVHKGRLYAGTGTWDWEAVVKGKGVVGPNHVYRYDGGTTWHDCGKFGGGYRVMSLASYAGNLYASDDAGFFYRYDADGVWTLCIGKVPGGDKFFSMMVYQNRLYGSTSNIIYRYEGGTTWTPVSDTLFGETQIHTLHVYRGQLYAGSWPSGKVMRYEGGMKWTVCGQLGTDKNKTRINEVNDLTVYNGKMYAGVIPRAEVWRYEDGQNWSLLAQLVTNPAFSVGNLASWNRVPSMTVFQGRLYAGTSTCHGRADKNALPDVGRVVAIEAGKSVSYHKDLPADWSHLAAVRQGGRLKLYVDGRGCTMSSAFDAADYDISTDRPMDIGFGSSNYFTGSMRDVRLYGRALTDAELLRLSQ